MREHRLIFLSACLGMLLFGIGLITLGSVATDLQSKFHLDKVDSGVLFSILPIGIIAGSFLFGPFSDRYGYKLFLLLSCICLFIGFQGIAYASSLDLLRAFIFLFGFGCGAINGASNAIVSDISKDKKGANLSLLGVFFGVGALGMPFVLGVLEKQIPYHRLISIIGVIPLLTVVTFLFVRFPTPKQSEGIPFLKGIKLLNDNVLLLIGLFLFCQSSFEGIINNWTTAYLSSELLVSNSKALYALSLYVAGMITMRLVIGSILRESSPHKILSLSFGFLLTGCLLLVLGNSYHVAMAGLVMLGGGLAAGFPIMLGFVGDRYTKLSGTAFSLVLVMALVGNMSINYLMGIIAEVFGIQHLITVAFTLSISMVLLSLFILKKIKLSHL